MAFISRDSLQWHSAVNTFTSIMLSGIGAIGIFSYLSSSLITDTDLHHNEVILYISVAVMGLIILALFFSARTYKLLSRPLENLEHITHALPLLSSKQYDSAKKVFKLVDAHSKHHEITSLQFASLQLASVLENLDSKNHQRSMQIFTQKEELQHERDFIKNLLDTAQLMIITVDKDLKVAMFNGYAEKISGFTQNDMLETAISRMFPAGNWTEAEPLYKEIITGNMNIAQQDAEMIDANGHIKQISWLHSRIESLNDNEMVLSVGLDMTAKREAEKHIVWLADHDPLTDLPNRRKFTAEFEKSLQVAKRYHHKNALLFLDLDHFKDINDTSGHAAGDELLKIVAKTLIKVTRYSDLVARLGGDEFAILVPEIDQEGTTILAKKIIHELAQIDLTYGKIKHQISTSIGVVHFPIEEASIHELLSFADLAMYKAKADGKGTFHNFSVDDKTKEQLETRVFWKHQISNALEKKLFVLYFQPIMDVQTSTIEHYEVLVRMRNDETGEISLPSKFIQVAEETGLIHSIDHYVLQHSMKKLASLEQQGIKAKLAINLSGAVVDDPVLIPMLKRFISKYKVNPQNLIFEITETAAVSNLQQAKVMMNEIRKLGCKFSLDDFGVGFASFNYMRELPVDIIKIDGIFIKDLDKNADDQLFVKALTDVAKGLGKKTIAEFVQNKETLNLLRKFGVDYAQGYYIGRPKNTLKDSIHWLESEAD